MKAYPESVRAEALRLREQGFGYSRIAARLGVSMSTVRRWVNPAYDERMRIEARARKETYRGICQDCGAKTVWHSVGNAPASRCKPCRNAWERSQKKWTGEAIIDAIQRFVAANGRPPFSSEWNRADTENDYPPKSNVYRSSHKHSSPFATWADAIEAAGSPRPRVGGYERSPETLRRLSESVRRAKAAA